MTNWPVHTARVARWASTSRRGTRGDRMLTEVTVSIPPMIADAHVPVIAERDLARARYEAVDLERVADGVLRNSRSARRQAARSSSTNGRCLGGAVRGDNRDQPQPCWVRDRLLT